MADIHIERPHNLSAQTLKTRLMEMETKLADRYGVRLVWRGDEADVKGPGVGGTVSILAQSVVVDLKLGLLVRAFAGKVRETMEKQLDRALSTPE